MAGRYSDELIEEIRGAVDLVDIASRYVRLKRSGSGYVGCCPFHREKTPSFHIDPVKQLYHCFGCGVGGSVFQFIMNAEGLDFVDAVKYLADGAGIRLPELDGSGGEEKYRRKQDMYAMNRDAARFFRECLFSEEGKAAREYFARRGLTGKTVASFGLGYSPSGWDGLLRHMEAKGYRRDMLVEAGLCIRNERGNVYDRFRSRVMFPIFDVRGNLIGFAGRIMDGGGAKYMNSPESIIYDKGKNLFALNLARKSRRGYYILVEGYMDVISLHQAGIDCAVAGCGTALTEAQARLLAKGNTVYLCYDMDEAGRKARDRAEEIFKGLDAKLRVISLPDGKDADEFIKKYGGEQFEKLLEKASSVTGNRVDSLLDKYDANDISQKVELINEAAAMFAGIPNAVEREAYIRDLSARTGISADAISAEVRKAGGRQRRKELNDEVRRSVSPTARNAGFAAIDREANATPAGTTPADARARTRRLTSERRLLGVLCDDPSIFGKMRDNLGEELFSSDLHRDIFLIMKNSCESGANVRDELLKSYRGREDELAAVLIKNDDPSDPLRAAADYINVIENEAMKARIAEAEKNGDVALLAELLKNNRKVGM